MTATPDAKPLKGLFIRTYGCQMNVYDSERIRDVLKPLGYAPVDAPEGADLVVINTCHIREKATEKVYSELGKLKQMKLASGGKMTIAVAGCVAQAEGAEIIRRQPAVDLVLGPQAYHKLPEMIARASRAVGDRLETEFDTVEKFDALPKTRDPDGPAAFVSVQEGCDKFCTFCVVPYTRGAEMSRNVDDIVLEIRDLAAKGVREVTLLGQNVNAFHGPAPRLEGGADWTLGQLVRHIAKIGGIERIRYTTSHPRDMDDDLIAAHGDTPAMMPFLHLPVQSGSDRILKAMNRGHTADEYRDIIARVRKARPDIAIASDFIVGFPGESDADFDDTMRLVDETGFASAYTFKYSRRPGTPGAVLGDQLDENLKTARLAALQSLLGAQQRAFNDSKVGTTVPVLFAEAGRKPGQVLGKSPWLQSVYVEGDAGMIGSIVDVHLRAAYALSLTGEVVTGQSPTGRSPSRFEVAA